MNFEFRSGQSIPLIKRPSTEQSFNHVHPNNPFKKQRLSMPPQIKGYTSTMANYELATSSINAKNDLNTPMIPSLQAINRPQTQTTMKLMDYAPEQAWMGKEPKYLNIKTSILASKFNSNRPT